MIHTFCGAHTYLGVELPRHKHLDEGAPLVLPCECTRAQFGATRGGGLLQFFEDRDVYAHFATIRACEATRTRVDTLSMAWPRRPFPGPRCLSRRVTQFRRREGWVPHREGKNHGCRKSFPGVRLSFCPTNLGALITLPTQAHHEELIGAAGSYRFEP